MQLHPAWPASPDVTTGASRVYFDDSPKTAISIAIAIVVAIVVAIRPFSKDKQPNDQSPI